MHFKHNPTDVLGVSRLGCRPGADRSLTFAARITAIPPGIRLHLTPSSVCAKFLIMKMTLDAFDARFPDEEACKTFLKDQRWPAGVKANEVSASFAGRFGLETEVSSSFRGL